MIGAGFMGQGLTNQIENSVPGMRMAAVYNRHREGRCTSSAMRAANVVMDEPGELDAASARANRW